jgi:hypothetical protein
MAQDEQEQHEPVRQIYDPGFPAVSSRFRPLSAPRAYQGRSYVRASTGGQVRKEQSDEQEAAAQPAERTSPPRCASAPEKAFAHNVSTDILWKGETTNNSIPAESDGGDRPSFNGARIDQPTPWSTCWLHGVNAHPFTTPPNPNGTLVHMPSQPYIPSS